MRNAQLLHIYKSFVCIYFIIVIVYVLLQQVVEDTNNWAKSYNNHK